MQISVKACLFTSLILALSLAGSVAEDSPQCPPLMNSCGFGTWVLAGDPNLGLPLDNFLGAQGTLNLGYWDIGAESGYFDISDIVYLHIGTLPDSITSNDIRLTPFESDPSGSKVTAADNDIGMALKTLPCSTPPLSGGGIWYSDMYGITPGFDAGDSVYVKAVSTRCGPFIIGGSTVMTNDVRVTDILTPKGMLRAGEKVQNLDDDTNNLLSPLVGFPVFWGWPVSGSVATVRFYNANGNFASGIPVYDFPDVVYIDMPFVGGSPAAGAVSPGDLRLTPMYGA